MPTPLPDVAAITALHEQYHIWLRVADAQLAAHAWSAAFRNEQQAYPYYQLQLPDLPLAHLDRPLAQARIALITSAGIYRADQPRFDDASVTGDASYRRIPVDTDRAQLRIAHAHYDHAAAEQDINSVFPLDRLQALAADGVIGSLAPIALSCSGYITDAEVVVTQLSADIVREVRGLGADAALLVPV